jgi:L-ascorbate metabolism protein UlaG (beta-lactamase superfamily)
MKDIRLKFTYFGGPTALLELGGLRLLTDPTFDPAGEEYPSRTKSSQARSVPLPRA